jgi:hypothetical protein
MAQIGYTKRVFVQRIRKHVSDSRNTSDQFSASDNEILLLIDQNAATRIVGQSYAGAKVEGTLYIAEAYLITFSLPELKQDKLTQYWFSTLPQPPMSMPLGYSVNRVYFKGNGFGESEDAYAVKAKRVGRRRLMPMQPGIRYWIEGNTIWLAAHDGSQLDKNQLFVQMPSARTVDMDAVMNMPEDDIQFVFDATVKELMQRYQIPQDVVLDNLPAGNKSS